MRERWFGVAAEDGNSAAKRFAQARHQGVDNPTVLWIAATACPFDSATCRAGEAVQRLCARFPRELGPALLELGRAAAAGDHDSVRRLLGDIGRADHDTDRDWALRRAAVDVLALAPIDASQIEAFQGDLASPQALRRATAELVLTRIEAPKDWPDVRRGNQPHYWDVPWARGAESALDAACADDEGESAQSPVEPCVAAARHVAETASARRVAGSAYVTLARIAPDPEARAATQATLRDERWLHVQGVRLHAESLRAAPDSALAVALEEWLALPSAVAASRAVLAQAGTPLTPPADWCASASACGIAAP